MVQVSLTEVTRSLAEEALRLHRLALATEDVKGLRSPATSGRSDDGIPRPTEDTAMCPRRARVCATAHEATRTLADVSARLSHALDVWEGATAP